MSIIHSDTRTVFDRTALMNGHVHIKPEGLSSINMISAAFPLSMDHWAEFRIPDSWICPAQPHILLQGTLEKPGIPCVLPSCCRRACDRGILKSMQGVRSPRLYVCQQLQRHLHIQIILLFCIMSVLEIVCMKYCFAQLYQLAVLHVLHATLTGDVQDGLVTLEGAAAAA